MTKKNNTGAIVGAIIVGIIAAIIAAIVWLLTSSNETHTSSGDNYESTESVSCNAKNLDDAFFRTNNVQRSTHEIKGIFDNGKLSKISYEYSGSFSSEDTAKNAEAELMAKYNTYMTEHELSIRYLDSVIMANKTKLRVSLYGERDKLNHATAGFFFLSEEEVDKISKYSAKELGDLYAKKGFSCEYSK